MQYDLDSFSYVPSFVEIDFAVTRQDENCRTIFRQVFQFQILIQKKNMEYFLSLKIIVD